MTPTNETTYQRPLNKHSLRTKNHFEEKTTKEQIEKERNDLMS